MTVSRHRWENIFLRRLGEDSEDARSREPDKKGSSEWGRTTFPEDETENYIFRAEEMETTLDKRGLASG